MPGKRNSQHRHEYEYLEGQQLPDRSALEKVLSETLSDKPTEPLHEKELDALISVAKRHLGAPMSLEPVTVELVESLLRARLTRIEAPDEYWQKMSLAIATSLYEAPVAKRRLTGLWDSLVEAAR